MTKPSEDLEVLLSTREEDLFVLLGSQLLDDGLGFGGADPDRRRKFAQTWFEERLPQIRLRLCAGGVVASMKQKPIRETMVESGVVIDALAALFGHPTATTVAAILMGRGIDALCAE